MHACLFVGLLLALHKYLVNIGFEEEAETPRPVDHVHRRWKLSNLDGSRRLRCPLDVWRWMKAHAKTKSWKSIGKQCFLFGRVTGLERRGWGPDQSLDALLSLKISVRPSANWFYFRGFRSLFSFWWDVNQAEPSLVYDDKTADVQTYEREQRPERSLIQAERLRLALQIIRTKKLVMVRSLCLPSPFYCIVIKYLTKYCSCFSGLSGLGYFFEVKQQRNLPQSCCVSHHHRFLNTGWKDTEAE